MPSPKQIIVTTVFGPQAENLGRTFGTFAQTPDCELHAFVYNEQLPQNRHPAIRYHQVTPDPAFVSVRRDALFRRWLWPDDLDAEYALVVDGLDALCVRPLPPMPGILRGASVAAAPEWLGPQPLLGQGYTSCYLNAGVTFWHLAHSRTMRAEIAERGRAHYRGPYDDQTTLNEVVHTRYFDDLIILPSQYNWRAMYQESYRGWRQNFRSWPRVDQLDGIYIYHNQVSVMKVLAALQQQRPAPHANLRPLTPDRGPLNRFERLWRQLRHRLGPARES